MNADERRQKNGFSDFSSFGSYPRLSAFIRGEFFLCVSVPLRLNPYLNFNVERLKSANKIARIKNRKTIFDSFQPTISK